MSKPRRIADFPNKADDYDQAVSKSHDQNTDTVLDEGGDNEVTAEDIVGHIENEENPHGTTAGQVGAYTKAEADGLLDDKFDKSGGDIEGVTRIVTPSASALVVERTGNNAQSVRLRITGTGLSGEAPEATIDSLPEDDDIPLYVPGRISTGTGFYIGSTRKDQEWDAKVDQSALTTTQITDITFSDDRVVVSVNDARLTRTGDLFHFFFDFTITENNAVGGAVGHFGQSALSMLGGGSVLVRHNNWNSVIFAYPNNQTTAPGSFLFRKDGESGFMTTDAAEFQVGSRFLGNFSFYF